MKVSRDRDGRSFSARRVEALQRGKAIFTMAASFHVDEESGDWSGVPMRADVPSPEELDTMGDDRIRKVRAMMLRKEVIEEFPYHETMPTLEKEWHADRIDTLIDFEAAKKYHVKTDGSDVAATQAVLQELTNDVDQGKLEIPIARVYPLTLVREAFQELEKRHTHGKIVLVP